jgi:predicted phosphodiesterase
MKYLIISDLHGNWDALRKVLREAESESFDAVLMLGDVVGYGAAPNRTIELLRDLEVEVHSVRGNHDKVVCGIDDGSGFNAVAQYAAQWSKERLTPENLSYVQTLPQGPKELKDGTVICHGSPRNEDEYLLSNGDAAGVFSSGGGQVTFFGHTHIACVFLDSVLDLGVSSELLKGPEGSLEIGSEVRYLINPGSVGQPRDRDPRAAYMFYDSDEGLVRWKRVEYPVNKAQYRILKAGLPRVLADRLSLGA